MTDRVVSLAADFLGAQGWAGILIKPARDESGIRIWFRRRREADRVTEAFLSRCELVRRRARSGLTRRSSASASYGLA